MPDAKTDAPVLWDQNATYDEVRQFALRALADSLALFKFGHDWHSNEQMLRAVAGIRNVATRADQFRRLSLRRWSAEKPAQTQTHKGNT